MKKIALYFTITGWVVSVAMGLLLGSSGCVQSESNAKTLARAKAKQLSQAATMAAFHDQDYKKAILLLDSATKIDSNYLFAYSSKLICQLTLNRFDDALGTVKNMNRIQPESPDYYVTIGILYDKKGDSGMAKTYYENAAIHYNKVLDTMRTGNKARGILLMNCGIDLILAGRKQQGEDILSRLYAGETEPAFKEVLASYMNKSRQAILDSLTQWQNASASMPAAASASVPATVPAKKE
jgi:tetratricopeptide (TPR) repeat protein